MSEENEKPSIPRVIFSTMAAFFGVQSDKNRRRDFQQSSILPFMISGVILATLFIVTLVIIGKQLAP